MTSLPAALRRVTGITPAARMAAMLFGIGTLHFLAPKPFDGIIPTELPGTPRFYTYASGAAEIGVAAALAAPRTRKAGAAAAAALFLAVWPGNFNMCRLWWHKPWPMRAIAIARLPLQIPMITTALKIYRES
ncbi:DoxX family protein [Mycobacterium sp. IDR2000157661]|uniref:DoxX family protein n=1 Tax=Mycobacterium sp. IDR2000157661 TaxID=2867005 RepID=UPI001EEA741F|nr:hypothetical protein [Mycobacterium sp. IDR2000157661]ULE33537.1 hypothetical protein K3G64_02135 [Mycobacterium sp. IDR2000157661]